MSYLRVVFGIVAVAVYGKLVWAILDQYRWYFPPDFENGAFLMDRRGTFHGIYAVAFYSHLLFGPAALLVGTFQAISARVARLRSLHRRLGWPQTVFIVLVGLSGLVMAREMDHCRW